jgi:outer membrane protein OmpA-like peptidoglycan-associated protein
MPLDPVEKGFELVEGVAKLLITLAAAVIAFSVTFSKEIGAFRLETAWDKTTWALALFFMLISVGGGVWTLLALTTVLAPKSPPVGQLTIRDRRIRFPFGVQIIAFSLSTLFAVLFGLAKVSPGEMISGDAGSSDPRMSFTVELHQWEHPPLTPPLPEPPEVNIAVEILRDDTVVLSQYEVIYFDVDKWDGPEVASQVERIAERIKQRRRDWPCEVLVYGHADTQGGDEHNATLSARRVAVVTQRLRDLQIPDAVVTPIRGAGERQLAVLTGDEVDRWGNRRVDVAVQCRK